ncbi:MAG: LD-carboxypeptidase [Bacteroidales bacterium]|nr:LD-carboxypeptidase [Bacteroidales bacterium]
MKIKIVSPSGAIDPQYIDRATEVLRGWGYEVSEAAHARGKVGRFAASDDERVADLAEALTDPAVDMILCARGGYGLQRIIDRIPPIHKPIIGFSDITALHMLAAQTGQATIHAMMCKGISETNGLSPSSCVLHPSSFLQRALAQEPLHYELPAHPLNRAGKTKGTLIGGNLSVLYGLQGTAYGLNERLRIKDKRLNSNDFKEVRSLGRTQYKDASETKVISPSSNESPLSLSPSLCREGWGGSPLILFIEDVGERHYHIDRMMNNLRLSGVLANLSGLIVGQFNDCEDDPSMGCTIYETIRHAVEPYHYPVVFNFPAGHVEENMPLYLNAPVEIDVREDYSSSIHSFFKSS